MSLRKVSTSIVVVLEIVVSSSSGKQLSINSEIASDLCSSTDASDIVLIFVGVVVRKQQKQM